MNNRVKRNSKNEQEYMLFVDGRPILLFTESILAEASAAYVLLNPHKVVTVKRMSFITGDAFSYLPYEAAVAITKYRMSVLDTAAGVA